jgi:hypothetical protein
MWKKAVENTKLILSIASKETIDKMRGMQKKELAKRDDDME